MLDGMKKFRMLLLPLSLVIEIVALAISYTIAFILIISGLIGAVLNAVNSTMVNASMDLPDIKWYLEGWSKQNNKDGKQTDNR
jgi:hypothetical protein